MIMINNNLYDVNVNKVFLIIPEYRTLFWNSGCVSNYCLTNVSLKSAIFLKYLSIHRFLTIAYQDNILLILYAATAHYTHTQNR